MTGLTTHILDTANGRPANGVTILLFRDGDTQPLGNWITNEDGRCDTPLLTPDQMQKGSYRLEFSVADYFRSSGHDLPEPPFLDKVLIQFGIAETDAHYHVPLLVSPFGYSTYRGS